MATKKLPKREDAEAEQESKPRLEREENIENDKSEVGRADPFWEHVEFLLNNRLKCNFCGNQYAGSETEIKAHLAGVGGYGIHGCKVVDAQVRSEALKALKDKTAVESGNGQGDVEEGSHQPVTVSNEDSWRGTLVAAVPRLSSDVISTVGASSSAFLPLPEMNLANQSLPAQNKIPQRAFSFWQQPPQSQAGDSYIQPPPLNAEEGRSNIKVPQALKRKLEEVSSLEADADELETWFRKVNKIKEEFWCITQAFREGRSLSPQQVERVDDSSKEVEEILGHGSFRKGSTTHAAECRKSSPLLTTKLVGHESENKIKQICDYVMEDEISIVGIYGMGGVGKTAILMHVHNRVLLENPAFDDVFWVTVPQEFSEFELQDKIANAVGLDNFSKEMDVKRRACILNRHLKKKRSILILDGLWMHFDVKDVGIPVEMGSLKLVLSTRSLDVCCMMLCKKQIKIELLDRKESWRLFLKTLCFAGELPSDVEEIAKFIVHKCDGLPLGIIEIATRLRGVEKVYEWKGMLQKFKDSRIELDVFKRLKLSYTNLGDHQVQQCFLHLVLCFGENLSETNREHLIESFIDEGLLGGIATLQELYDQGNAILDKMRKACLLDNREEEYLYLHPLTRYMALHIVTSTTHMVKASMGLKEIPEEVFWTDRLEKVFLQGNKIEETTYSISPNCPKLTRLSLNDNVMLGNIHSSFFWNLKVLKNVDLSNTQITELPESICHLESLEVLSLRRCRAIKLIPNVGKLGYLRKLDLQGCSSLDEVPEGMEMLVNLRYLDLADTKIETLSERVLGKLVNLRYLAIKKVRAGEGAKLKKLEALDCSVPDVETFNACVRFLVRNSSQRYKLVMDASYHCESETERRIFIDSCDHITASVDGTSGDGCALIPESVKSFGMSRCHKMKRVMEWEWMTTRLSKLEEIIVYDCDELEEIMSGPLPSRATCFLTYLGVNGCNNMKRVLLTQDMLLHLPFLQEISVQDCKGIEVIIGTVANKMHSCLPKLIHLGLWNLPELKSICDGTMSCDSLQWISILNCPKLRRISLQLSVLDNGLPSPPPSLQEIRINQQTWESLEWDNPLARASLEHLVQGSWFD